MEKKGLLRLVVPISLVIALGIGAPLMSGCLGKPAVAPPEVPPEVAPPEAPPVEAPPEAPPAEVVPIKVGAPLPMTGWYAGDGRGYFQGITSAVDELNAQGGLLGRPIEMILYDTKDIAPETLRLASDQLVAVDGVDMANGGWSGWGGDIYAFGKYDIPYFCYDGAESSLQAIMEPGNNNCFQGSDNEYNSGVDAWEFMVNLPYEYPNNKVALISSDDYWGTGVIEGIRDLAEANGWEVAVYEVVPYGTVEWGTILAKIQAAEPAWLHIEIVSAPEVVSFYNQFTALDDIPQTLLCYGYSLGPPDVMQTMGTDADGIVGWAGGYFGFPPATPETAEWLDRFMYKFGNPPSAGAPWMYNSTMMWAEAVRQVGDPTEYDAIVDWIENNKFQAMPGFRTLNLSVENRHVTPHAEFAGVYVQVQGGEFYTLYHNVYGDPYVDYEGNSYDFQIPWWITE